jgi:Ca2+-transporting ATPase
VPTSTTPPGSGGAPGAGLVAGGLTSEEARRRLAEVGPNSPPSAPRKGLARRAGEQLRDPMIVVLQAAAVLSALLRDWPNTVIIAAVVVFNTAAGVIQQYRADRAMAELRRLVAPVALARRDGALVTVPADELVPGDEVSLVGGDVVPADAVVVDPWQLEVDEAAITGESLAVPRGAGEELLGGTRVTRGRATAVLTRTGADSGLGRIAALLAGTPTRPTPLQARLTRLSRALVVLVLVLTAVVVFLGLVQGRPWTEMVVVGLSLTVAAVPESLPAVVTVALAMGAHRMARRHAVVRALPAVETLGSVTVVATDKTGTITEGRMLAQVLWLDGDRYDVTGAAYDPVGEIRGPLGPATQTDPRLARLLRDVVLCNDAALVLDEDGAWGVVGDPLEGALVALAGKGTVTAQECRSAWPRTGEEPFDHAARSMTTHHRGADGGALSVCKGAPEAVLALVAPDPEETAAVHAAAGALAASGLRVIAVADREAAGEWRMAGLVGVGDPPRTTAAEVVGNLRTAGIRVVLVTGDHAGTASAIARRVGIADAGDEPVEGGALADVPPEQRHVLTVVARVLPEQKVDVVESLQQAGEVVAMLGDGVNDAPALRRADIGVAAGRTGTEVAKEAADLVLTDDELASVVAAVEEGRRIFANIRAFLVYAVSGGLAEVGVMLGGALVGLSLPLLPGQILWINLLTHGLVGVAFGAEPLDPDEMTRPPRPPSESVFTRLALTQVVVLASLLTVAALAVGAVAPGDDALRRTAVFLALGGGQLGVALALRAPRPRGTGPRGRGLELSILGAAFLLAAAVYLPPLHTLLHTLPLSAGTVALALAAAVLPGLLLRLWLSRHRSRRGGSVLTTPGRG